MIALLITLLITAPFTVQGALIGTDCPLDFRPHRHPHYRPWPQSPSQMDFGKELSSMSAVGRSLLSVGAGEGGGAGVEGAGVEAVGITSATDDAGEGPLYELIVKVPSRNRLLADLSATLSQLDLDVLDGDCLTDEKGRANDRLRVRDLSAAGRAAAKAAAAAGGSLEGVSAALAARVQQALCDALEATRLLQVPSPLISIDLP